MDGVYDQIREDALAKAGERKKEEGKSTRLEECHGLTEYRSRKLCLEAFLRY